MEEIQLTKAGFINYTSAIVNPIDKRARVALRAGIVGRESLAQHEPAGRVHNLIWSNHIFVKGTCGGRKFKRRARREYSGNGVVYKWAARVLHQLLIIIVRDKTRHAIVLEGWIGNHCQNLTCLWIHGNNDSA